MRDKLAAVIRAEVADINGKQHFGLTSDEISMLADILAERLTLGRDPYRSGRRIYDRLRERLMSVLPRMLR
jgi:hypothetical protein